MNCLHFISKCLKVFVAKFLKINSYNLQVLITLENTNRLMFKFQLYS